MPWALFVAVVIFALSIARCNNSETVYRTIEKAVPAEVNLSAHKAAYEYLAEQVELCGGGVIEGAKDEQGQPAPNRCGYQVRVDEEFIRQQTEKLGFKYDEEKVYEANTMWIEPKADNVPDNFDVRDLMTGGAPNIKDQAWNDCWANASTSGYEIARSVSEKKPFNHSTQTMISCSGKGTAASGGYMEAFDFAKNGLPLESEWPYAGKDLKCKWDKSQLQAGWVPKLIDTPYIGNSLNYSRALKAAGGFSEGTKVKAIKAAMWAWKSSAVVTVAAYSISGDGVYDSCSSINSGGNHMVNIVGWDGPNAHVWNSWGLSHGKNGVSRIKWECGDGKLNRGLGVAAKIGQFRPPCEMPIVSFDQASYVIFKGSSIKLGRPQPAGVKCQWVPTDGVEDPKSCVTYVSPAKATEYHIQATNDCGTSSAMTLVQVLGPLGRPESDDITTPTGVVKLKELAKK